MFLIKLCIFYSLRVYSHHTWRYADLPFAQWPELCASFHARFLVNASSFYWQFISSSRIPFARVRVCTFAALVIVASGCTPNLPWSYMYPWAAAVAVLPSGLVRICLILVPAFLQIRTSQVVGSRVPELLSEILNNRSGPTVFRADASCKEFQTRRELK
jgi:hypothetical protein